MDSSDRKRLATCSIIIMALLMFLLLAGSVVAYLLTHTKEALPTVGIEDTSEVYLMPTEVESIRDIGQWEFMTINDEEVIDTIRRGFFSDDRLVRIYYGSLRLGLDLSHIGPNDLSLHGDTLIAHLPDVALLDEDFIDEGRTRSFYESGSWSGSDRRDLYLRACQQMKERCMTPATLAGTRQIADVQLRQMFKAMRFENVVILFDR